MLRIVLIYVLPILLAIYALIDCIQTDQNEIRGLPRIGWIALIVLVGVVGPIAWLVAGRSRSGRSLLPRLPLPGSRESGRAAPPRTLAPDDDPEFLGRLGSSNSYDRALEQWEQDERLRDEQEQKGPEDDPPPDDGSAGDRSPR